MWLGAGSEIPGAFYPEEGDIEVGERLLQEGHDGGPIVDSRSPGILKDQEAEGSGRPRLYV